MAPGALCVRGVQDGAVGLLREGRQGLLRTRLPSTLLSSLCLLQGAHSAGTSQEWITTLYGSTKYMNESIYQPSHRHINVQYINISIYDVRYLLLAHMPFSSSARFWSLPLCDQNILTAMDLSWHPEHFFCAHCGDVFGPEGEMLIPGGLKV